MHLQSRKLERGISDGVIAHLADGGAWFCVVMVADEEMEETPPQYLREMRVQQVLLASPGSGQLQPERSG